MVTPNLGYLGVKNDDIKVSKDAKTYVIMIDKIKRIELSKGTSLKKAYEMCEQIIRNSPCERVQVFNGDFCEFTMINNRCGQKK